MKSHLGTTYIDKLGNKTTIACIMDSRLGIIGFADKTYDNWQTIDGCCLGCKNDELNLIGEIK